MDHAQVEVLEALHDRYNMNEHGRGDAQQVSAMTPEFIDRFAVVGDPDRCLERLAALQSLGLDKLAVNGPTFINRSPEASDALALFESEVLSTFV
ncbi:hypothetical protein C2W62_32120 [Candidatus Entotheonella serta]|nr:hypothetical protein C2W62_32120 [Candidatus Entotheonella serta]